MIDMATFEHSYPSYDAVHSKCVADFLFTQLHPAQVKTLIQGSDFGEPTAIRTQAEQHCAGVWQPPVF